MHSPCAALYVFHLDICPCQLNFREEYPSPKVTTPRTRVEVPAALRSQTRHKVGDLIAPRCSRDGAAPRRARAALLLQFLHNTRMWNWRNFIHEIARTATEIHEETSSYVMRRDGAATRRGAPSPIESETASSMMRGAVMITRAIHIVQLIQIARLVDRWIVKLACIIPPIPPAASFFFPHIAHIANQQTYIVIAGLLVG